MRKGFVGLVILIVLLISFQPCEALGVNTNLQYGEYYAVYGDVIEGGRIEGSFTTVNSVEFFISDVGNYSNWIRNEYTVLYEHHEETTTRTFNLTIPHSAIWYVVISNSYVTSSTTLQAEIYFIDNEGVVQTQVSVITQNLISTPLIVAFIAAGLGISILGVWFVRRRGPTPAVRYDEILRKPS